MGRLRQQSQGQVLRHYEDRKKAIESGPLALGTAGRRHVARACSHGGDARMTGWRWLRAMFRREQLDRDFDEEIRSHLDLAAEDHIARGVPEQEARRLARMQFGAIQALK